MFTILELANQARVSKEKARYWLKLLDLAATRKEGKLFFPVGSVEMLQAMKSAIASGAQPAAAAIEVKALHSATNQAPIIQAESDLADRIKELEKAVLLLAENNQELKQQNRALLDLVQAQNCKLDRLESRLLPPAESKPVQAWQPTAKKAPQVSWIKRAWLELINPEQLRAMP